MRTFVIILSVALFFGIASTQPDDLRLLTTKMEAMLSAQFKRGEPGATALVARNGRIIYSGAFGKANLELGVPMQTATVFKIGSITKQFTAVAILQLMEQGKLSLQDEITRFIPDYPTQGHRITVEHLLTHTSGIVNYSAIRDTQYVGAADLTPLQLIDRFKDQPMRFAPGTRWEYSNSGYALLGHIIELLSGMTYGEYIEQHVLRPARMLNSHYGNDIRLVMNRADGYVARDGGFVNASYLSVTHPYAAGSILSTVEDLFKWNRALLSNKLLTKETLERAWKRFKLVDGSETRYGYGWRIGYIQESPSLWHGGMVNGFITMALYLPNEDVFVAVFSNCESNSPEDITAKLAALAIGRPYEYKEIDMSALTLQQYAGVYEGGNGQLRIMTVAENRLFSQIARGPKVAARPFRHDRFFFDDNQFLTFTFERNSTGEVKRLVTRNRDMVEVWKKTDKPIPSPDGIRLSEDLLDRFVGTYEIRTGFAFSVTKEGGRLFVQATGQDKLEMFAETEWKFFLKVNDAEFEFVRNDAGQVEKAILRQGGRIAESKKIR